ncbi:MAG: DUF1499 domain-containing protein [Sediminispirochaetaceae bacterium]
MKYVLPYLCLVSIMVGACSSAPQNSIGMQNSSFRPCPDSPNCVSSMASDSEHAVQPLAYSGMTMDEARASIVSILETAKRCRIITMEERYIHAEFRSLVFRFVDDVEFYFPGDASIVHVKSASRLGYSDFGVNRKRVEQIRSAFSHPASGTD